MQTGNATSPLSVLIKLWLHRELKASTSSNTVALRWEDGWSDEWSFGRMIKEIKLIQKCWGKKDKKTLYWPQEKQSHLSLGRGSFSSDEGDLKLPLKFENLNFRNEEQNNRLNHQTYIQANICLFPFVHSMNYCFAWKSKYKGLLLLLLPSPSDSHCVTQLKINI